jgi:hypothetical protein
MFGLRLFFEFSPNDVVQDHLRRLAQRAKGDWSVVEDTPGAGSAPAGGEVVDEE